MTVRLELGDCLKVMPRLRRAHVLADCVVTDPPYHLTSIAQRLGKPGSAPIKSGATGVYARSSSGFSGQQWDGGDIAFRVETWRAVYDLLKPGAYLVAFGATRTYHRMVCAIEDAGFEILDQIAWLYGSGFPKNHAQPDGSGTALKPGLEPIVLAQKPIGRPSIAANIAAFGVGGLNIDACRIPVDDSEPLMGGQSRNGVRPGTHQEGYRRPWMNDPEQVEAHRLRLQAAAAKARKLGRHPANVIHDGSDEVLAAFPRAPGQKGTVTGEEPAACFANVYGHMPNRAGRAEPRGDQGGADRFFYRAKASWRDRVYRCRQCGIHQLGKPSCGHVDAEGNPDLETHPTVKPVNLMRWLVRLVCPEGGLVLDPFAGTGTTAAAAALEGRGALLIEQKPEYAADICVRLGLELPELAAATVAPVPSALDHHGPLFSVGG